MLEDIVITGLGVVCPIGHNESEFWDSLRTGRSGAAPVDCLDTSELSRSIGCQVRGFRFGSQSNESDSKINTEHSGTMSVGRAANLAVAAARQALESSGLNPADFLQLSTTEKTQRDRRLSIIVGTTMGETEFIEDELSAKAEDWLSPKHARRILSGLPGSIAEHVAESIAGQNDVSAGSGPREANTAGSQSCMDIYGACAAGNMAIEAARRQLLEGRCDVAIAGGADGFSRLAFIGFMRLRVMAAKVCRPFDVDRDGLFVGEGAAMFLLERESTARARGARIRARILGAGNACENYHPTRPHPDGDGLSRAIAASLDDAGLASPDVDYICAHGTGTPQNDAIEVSVMNRLFPAGVPFSSVKALTGHTMGAAAAVEAAACVLILEHQTLIPTWHLANVLQPCSLEALSNGPRAARLRCVLNNSAGFGGYNSSVVIAAA